MLDQSNGRFGTQAQKIGWKNQELSDDQFSRSQRLRMKASVSYDGGIEVRVGSIPARG